jgi:serine/threonine protein kinase
VGTDGYMAPEIHLNHKYNGEKVDIFALAVILFTMLTGQKPFEAARPDSYLFVTLAKGNYDEFWDGYILNLC